jgi:hypothetical protein
MKPERATGALWKSVIFVRRRRLSRVEAEGVHPEQMTGQNRHDT